MTPIVCPICFSNNTLEGFQKISCVRKITYVCKLCFRNQAPFYGNLNRGSRGLKTYKYEELVSLIYPDLKH